MPRDRTASLEAAIDADDVERGAEILREMEDEEEGPSFPSGGCPPNSSQLNCGRSGNYQSRNDLRTGLGKLAAVGLLAKAGHSVYNIAQRAMGKKGIKRVRGRGSYSVRKSAAKKKPVRPRSIARVKGRGGYFSDIGGLAGMAAGGYLGGGATGGLGAVGGANVGYGAGSAAGSLIDRALGMGAYTVKKNSLMRKLPEGYQVPAFGNMAHGTLVRHREYIGDVLATGATAFTNYNYPINPGLSTTFPWLAGIAKNFDTYQMMGCIFEFRTSSSDYAATSALGQVIMATNYDAADSTYPSKQVMENSQYAISNKPSVNQYHIIECDPSVTHSPIMYIRSGAVPSGKDVHNYDHGNFQIATNGLVSSGSTALGELWVTYEVMLYKPNIVNAGDNLCDHFNLGTSVAASTNWVSGDTTTTNNPVAGSTLLGTTKANTYTFNPTSIVVGQVYCVQYVVVGASTTLTATTAVALTGCTATNILGGTSLARNPAGTVSTTAFLIVFVTITSTTASILWNAGTLPGSITAADLWVSSVNKNITT